MSHEVFGNMAAYARTPAWHGLGRVFDEPLTATQAVEMIGADFNYTLQPVIAAIPDGNGKRIPLVIPGKRAIVRDRVNEGPEEVMGIVSDKYEIIQNTEFAAALDALTDQWPVETVGVLKRGKTIFFSLKAGETQLGSSTIAKYFLVTDNKTGTESARFMYTPIRVECQNCLTAALSSSAVQGTLVHRPGVTREFQFRTGLFAKLMRAQTEVDDAFEAMTKNVLSIAQRDLIFSAYWPQPRKNGRADFAQLVSENDTELRELRNMGLDATAEFERLFARRDVVMAELDVAYNTFNEQYPDHANTVWAAWNTVVEHADWSNTTDMSDYAALFGERAKRKRRAYQAAEDLL